jgi:hypothetical protein
MTHVRTMAPVTEREWYTWHHDYDSPGTALAQRIVVPAPRPFPARGYEPKSPWLWAIVTA